MRFESNVLDSPPESEGKPLTDSLFCSLGTRRPRRRSGTSSVTLIAVFTGLAMTRGLAREGDLIGHLPFTTIAPQDIAYDEEDGTFWITAFLDNSIYHYSADLKQELGSFPSPFGVNGFPTGIAYNSVDRTLLVTDALVDAIIEFDKTDGAPTGRELRPAFLPTPDGKTESFLRGLAFDPTGDNGRGSVYVLEQLGTLIYEVALDGVVLRHFSHPDDRDGFPGTGLQAPASDIDLIYDSDGALSGFYITGGRDRVEVIRRLNLNGEYEGVSISLEEAAGNVSGILRRPFPHPATQEMVDSFICVVESNGILAILEGGEPEHREIVNFGCVTEDREVILSWSSFGAYDRLEVWQGCTLVDTLGGDLEEWRHTYANDGSYEITLRAIVGDVTVSPPPCTAVVGRGQVLRKVELEPSLPIDIATNGADLILITDARDQRILLYDEGLAFLDAVEINEALLEEGDFLTGVTVDPALERIYLFNATKSQVGELDAVGALLRIFDARLPNLEEDPEKDPDLGFVTSMSFDPDGNNGSGSLWLVEAVTDTIFEIDLEGSVLSFFAHPYLDVDPPPGDVPRRITAYGVAQVPGHPDELYVGGGTYESRRQIHVLRVDKSTGQAIKGTEILTRGIEVTAGTASTNFVSWAGGGDRDPRLLVLPLAPRVPSLLEVDVTPPVVPAPTFVDARQSGYDNRVEVRFDPPPGVERLEVFRDCVRIATLPADRATVLEKDVPTGLHEYSVRGAAGGSESDFGRATVYVGPGAILESSPLWPAISPQQLTANPVDGSFYVVVNYLGDERTVFHYNRNFEFLSRRESVVEEPWQIATLAARRNEVGRVELNYIAWKKPVPLSEAGREQFFLVKESLSGEWLGDFELFPPRPTNGFVTYPTGLTWEPESDTFFFLERNSKTFVQMSSEGEILREFPHPAPPFQNFVFNLGVDFVPERGTLFITGAGRFDHRVAKVMEMDTNGNLTGVEIPLGNLSATVTGISVNGADLVAVGSDRGRAMILRLKAFDDLPESFVRGDVNRDTSVNLTDALVLLSHLFRGGPPPACEDAGDVDDDGRLSLTDGIILLTYLFASGPEPAAPHPEAGIDPTPDGLQCF